MEKEKDILDNLELRSENVQDILTQPPHWMIRWGNTVIFVILLMVLLMSYVIKYPEFIPAPIVVTSKNPPEKLEARTNSKIEKILVKDHQSVNKNQVMMVLQSAADYKDILALKDIVDSMSSSQVSTSLLNRHQPSNLAKYRENTIVLQKHCRMKNFLLVLSPMLLKILQQTKVLGNTGQGLLHYNSSGT